MATNCATPASDFFMPNLAYVPFNSWPIPDADEIGFCALGRHADSLPISLVKHEYCSFVSNSFATFFAFTCIKGGLGSYTIGIAGVGVLTSNTNARRNIKTPP